MSLVPVPRVTPRNPDPESVPAVGAPRFTGRGRELAAITSALTSPPALVLIEGEAGIGKSRLVQEYLAGADVRALVARCPTRCVRPAGCAACGCLGWRAPCGRIFPPDGHAAEVLSWLRDVPI
jgi:hypothetical protein